MIVLFILALSWLAAAVGLLARSPEAANSFTFVLMFLPYVSTAFVPAQTLPGRLRGFADTSRSPRSSRPCAGCGWARPWGTSRSGRWPGRWGSWSCRRCWRRRCSTVRRAAEAQRGQHLGEPLHRAGQAPLLGDRRRASRGRPAPRGGSVSGEPRSMSRATATTVGATPR